MEGSFVKLSDLLVISRVSSVDLTPPWVVFVGPVVVFLPLFVVLTPLTVNSLGPFVISNAAVR
jgi:hypothetical protein